MTDALEVVRNLGEVQKLHIPVHYIVYRQHQFESYQLKIAAASHLLCLTPIGPPVLEIVVSKYDPENQRSRSWTIKPDGLI